MDEVATLRREPHPARPPTAFFIGGGGYSLPRAWALDYPGARLTVAEIDPAVTQAAKDHLYLNPDLPEITIIHRDARAALQSLPPIPTFDLIFGDAFRDISVPPHLVTREFNSQIARRLTRDGFYAVNVVDNGIQPKFLFSMVKTLFEEFTHVEVWVDRDEAVGAGRVTFVLLASERPTPVATLSSTRGLKRTWIRWPEDDLRANVATAPVPILTDDYAPVDRLMSDLLLKLEN